MGRLRVSLSRLEEEGEVSRLLLCWSAQLWLCLWLWLWDPLLVVRTRGGLGARRPGRGPQMGAAAGGGGGGAGAGAPGTGRPETSSCSNAVWTWRSLSS